MIKTSIRSTSEKYVTSIVCDKCKKEYRADDAWEIQEFHRISFTGGYSSVFGDMVNVECDICQHCLKEMIGEIATIDGEASSTIKERKVDWRKYDINMQKF